MGPTDHTRLLDNDRAGRNRAAVSRLLKLIAVLLATLWLPTTMHCQLETVGFDALFACAGAGDAAHADGQDCTDDGCLTIESGQVTLSKSRLDAVLPAFLAGTDGFCVFEISAPIPAPEFFATGQNEALPLRRTWQFARRAAPPARAPATLNV